MRVLRTANFFRSIPTSDDIARLYFHEAADALDAKDRDIAWERNMRRDAERRCARMEVENDRLRRAAPADGSGAAGETEGLDPEGTTAR